MRNFDSLITLLTLLNQLSKALASLYIVSAAPALRQEKVHLESTKPKKTDQIHCTRSHTEFSPVLLCK